MLARVCTPYSPVREREREGGRERSVEYVQNILFLFLKGMTGALAPLIIVKTPYSLQCCKTDTLIKPYVYYIDVNITNADK
jgi:hypothetical protein